MSHRQRLRRGALRASEQSTGAASAPTHIVRAAELGSGAVYGGHFAQVRNVNPYTFDDSIDSTHPLECFFQMPTDTVLVKKAQVWVQRKDFRAYLTAAASGGSSTPTSSSAGASHSHALGVSGAATGGPVPPSDGHSHIYSSPPSTSDSGSASHDHTVTIGGHTHTITYGIFETAAAGTLSLKVADDGVNYGSALASGGTSITALDITSSLTTASGDKRIKIEGTGLTRVQVTLLLDLIVTVPPMQS